MKSQMLASTSHEFRNPIGGIISMLGLALDDPFLSKNTAKYLKVAYKSADLVLSLSNDMLDYSQIEKGTFRLTFGVFNCIESID